jgi:two-component system response regulator DevR
VLGDVRGEDAGTMTASNGNRTAVLLDQHPIWLEAVERVLARIGVEVVGKTTSPSEALTLLGQHGPDVFVTGLGMPAGTMDGLTCLRTARERNPGLKAVVLSAYDDPQHVEEALAAGAVAYVVKSAHPDDLASAIRQAFGHSIYLAGRYPAPAAVESASEPGSLTRREREILRLAAEGLSNAEIAKMLWVTEQTVKFHLSNVYRKLDVTNRTEASRWAQIHGLLPMPGVARHVHLGAA